MATYNWKITAKKFLIGAAEVIVAGLIVYLTENGFWLFLIPTLEAVRNLLKHKFGVRLP